MLAAFGDSPETFVFRNAQGADLVLFAIGVVLLPPLAIWWAGLVVGVVAPRWRLVAHGASLGALVALAAAPALAGLGGVLRTALAALLGIAAGALTVRSAPFRLWSELLVALPVFALVTFLVASPASDLLSSTEFAAATTTAGAQAPVVLIVLDELPTASIIDRSGAIDAVRFPNLARLAGQGTWYRNHTTQAGFTFEAVPSILTGQRPNSDGPFFTQHPDNLFRLLAGSHDLVVAEALTRLCPRTVCGDGPTAPVAAGSEAVVAESPTAAEPVMGPLFGDAADLWLTRLGGADGSVDFEAFEEELAAETAPPPDSSFGAAEVPEAGGTWQDAVAAQPERLTEFLAALEPADRPMAAVIHLVSPHFPWQVLPDGRPYAVPAEQADLPINGAGDPWVAELERQRHLLQASYTDRLVGQVLQRLEEAGVYDDAAIVVTADHGIAFYGDEARRVPVPDAIPEIAWTPLIIKAPGQRTAVVDDANVQSIDIVPTIAALLGIEIPWDVDGAAIGSAAAAARGGRKEFYRVQSGADPGPTQTLDIDGAEGLTAMLALAYPAVGPDEDPVAALYERSGRGDLIGEEYRPTGEVASGTLVVDDLDRLADGEEAVVVLTGLVGDGGEAEYVVASVDGRIVAVSPVVQRNLGGAAFALLLPTRPTVDLRDVRLGLLRGDAVLDGGLIVG